MKKTFNTLLWIAIIILFAISMCSCSPVKKLNRLQDRHSYLFEKKMDTLKIYDTTNIVVPGLLFDSTFPLFKLSSPGGITLSKENLTINIKHDTISDNISIDAKIDTVYINQTKIIEVPYNRYIVDAPKKRLHWSVALYGILLGLFLYFLFIRKE